MSLMDKKYPNRLVLILDLCQKRAALLYVVISLDETTETIDTMLKHSLAGSGVAPSPAVPPLKKPRCGSTVRHFMHAGCLAILPQRAHNAHAASAWASQYQFLLGRHSWLLQPVPECRAAVQPALHTSAC